MYTHIDHSCALSLLHGLSLSRNFPHKNANTHLHTNTHSPHARGEEEQPHRETQGIQMLMYALGRRVAFMVAPCHLVIVQIIP